MSFYSLPHGAALSISAKKRPRRIHSFLAAYSRPENLFFIIDSRRPECRYCLWLTRCRERQVINGVSLSARQATASSEGCQRRSSHLWRTEKTIQEYIKIVRRKNPPYCYHSRTYAWAEKGAKILRF